MFFKTFRVKSSTTMKFSERRKLRERVSSAYPSLTTENLTWLMPPKEDLSLLKVFVYKGDVVSVYIHKRNPILFELDGNFYPTVYTLWHYPDLLPVFTTWPPVLEKMAGGADLMLPGIVMLSFGLPEVQQGSLCSVVLVGNRAPVAIGITTMSTKDMLSSGMKGKGLTILHTYKDELWAYGDKSSPPNIAEVAVETALSAGQEQVIHQDSGNFLQGTIMENLCLRESETDQPMTGEEIPENLENAQEDASAINSCNTCSQEDMDDLLNQCFLHALKYKVKKSDLPLLTSTFLRNYLFACCPEGQHVDIKRSSYKKLSKFLHAMQKCNILEVKELGKGVESIVHVNWSHPDVRSFVASTTVGVKNSGTSEVGRQQPYQFPEITPLYGVTSAMQPLFQESKHRKGDFLAQSDVRNAIMLYVKENELVCPSNKNFVSINPVICDCLLNKSEQNEIVLLKWDELFTRCLERMQHSHQVTFPGQSPIMRKGNIEPIYIGVAQRASNKKVTSIKNLELYGLDPSSVGSLLQQKVQASASYTAIPGTKDRVLVQIQGNQVSQIGRLLLEHYKIPQKYVSGLDLAIKSGKKT